MTGATDGIGMATAECLAQAGRRLILDGRSAAQPTQVGAARHDRFPAADGKPCAATAPIWPKSPPSPKPYAVK